MASSYEYFKEEVSKYLKDHYPKESKVLDVGAGCGTYYRYLGDYFKEIECVEIYKGNIEKYELGKKYKKVYNEDIRNFGYKYYDIIIFGDIIEHLEVEEAQKVLRYAYTRCKEMVVAVPYMYEQGEEYGNIYEIHKQADLTPKIMESRYPFLQLLYGNELYGYYIKK